MSATARKLNSLDRYHELLERSHAAPIAGQPATGPLPPIATLNLFESAELEDLETHFGQQQLRLMPTPNSKSKIQHSKSKPTLSLVAPQPGEIVQLIEAPQIVRSPWNRTVFTEPGLQEMEDSIRAIGGEQEGGIIEPLVARPNPAFKSAEETPGVPPFELVAGERRWRGAQRIHASYRVPVLVRPYTDKQALEVQKIENLQREDLDPFEEARGLKQMMDEFGYTLEDLKARTGKEKSTIYGRVKLANLCADGVKAFRDGLYSESVAVRIARIPLQASQERFIGEVTQQWDDETPLSDRGAKEWIDRDYMKQLKGAPFKSSDATLVPVQFIADGGPENGKRLCGGACDDCPMRAGNQPDFDPKNGRADICLSPSCYRMKVEALTKAALAAHVEKGGAIATASKVFDSYGCMKHGGPYVQPNHTAYEVGPLPGFSKDKKHPSYGELAAHLKIPVALVKHPRGDELYTVIEKSAVLEAARNAGLKVQKEQAAAVSNKRREELEKEKERKALELRTTQVRALVAAAERPEVSGALNLALLLYVLRDLASDASHQALNMAPALFTLDLEKFKQGDHDSYNGARGAIRDYASRLAEWPEARGLLVALLAASPGLSLEHKPDALKDFARIFKVDLGKVAAKHVAAEKLKAAAAKLAALKEATAKKKPAKKPAKKGAAK